MPVRSLVYDDQRDVWLLEKPSGPVPSTTRRSRGSRPASYLLGALPAEDRRNPAEPDAASPSAAAGDATTRRPLRRSPELRRSPRTVFKVRRVRFPASAEGSAFRGTDGPLRAIHVRDTDSIFPTRTRSNRSPAAGNSAPCGERISRIFHGLVNTLGIFDRHLVVDVIGIASVKRSTTCNASL